MKAPSDAVLEWRCECHRLSGYVRIVDGTPLFTTKAIESQAEMRLGWPADDPDGTVRRMRTIADQPMPERRFLQLSCGSHYNDIQWTGLPPRSRKKLVVPVAISGAVGRRSIRMTDDGSTTS